MKRQENKEKNYPFWLLSLSVALIVLFIVAIGVGRYFISPSTVIEVLASRLNGIAGIHIPTTWAEQAESVIFTLRLPRIIAAVLVGCALSLSGASYQGVFENPLVAPDMLGVSAGACVGASLGILLHIGSVGIQISALVTGLVAVALATLIPKVVRNNSRMMLVLAGVIVSGLMNSILGLLKYLADPETELAAITHWQLGSLTGVTWEDICYIGPPILIASAVLIILRWRINLVSMGEVEARSLGVPLGKIRGIIIVCATVLTACSVCISGTIGWIGLVIPHFGRMLVGSDNCKLIPVSALLGAIFLLLMDTLARILTSAELPISILTGLIGAPFYFYLLTRQTVRE